MWQAIQNAFSSSSLAALRNVLTAAAVFVGALGIAGLTSTNLNHLVDAIMSVGTALAALLTAVSALVALLMPVIAAFKASLPQRAKSTAADIKAETGKPANQQPATIAVTDALGNRPDVKQVNVTDPALANAVPSDKVVAK